MGIRACALESKAFLALKEIYDHRDVEAIKWRENGGKVIGELGCDVPDEMIIAAGMLPIHVYADPRNNRADQCQQYIDHRIIQNFKISKL